MTAVEIAVVAGGLALIAGLAWYFFAPRTATHARMEGERQVVDITVRGGYSPNLVTVTAGQPVRLRFDRQGEQRLHRPRGVPRPAHERLAGRVRHHDPRPSDHRAR